MEPSSPHRPLSQKQKHFLDQYHITGDVGQSWLNAGYKCSLESASGNASRVLQRDDAQEYLRELQQHDRKKTGITREALIERFKEIFFSEDVRPHDVILAGRELARMTGAYNPPPEEEPVDTLYEFMARMRQQGMERQQEQIRQREARNRIVSENRATDTNPPTENAPLSPVEQYQRENNIVPPPQPTSEVPQTTPQPVEPPRPVQFTPIQKKWLQENPWFQEQAQRAIDWEPHYNPYYDPTMQQTRKRGNAEVIFPGR